jgi:hypothetical protein
MGGWFSKPKTSPAPVVKEIEDTGAEDLKKRKKLYATQGEESGEEVLSVASSTKGAASSGRNKMFS